jgi:hypothetical protein
MLSHKLSVISQNSMSFSVDGSRAGSGNLEILVNGGRVTSSVRALGGQRFVASFTPHETGIHTVQITFNGDTVPGELIKDSSLEKMRNWLYDSRNRDTLCCY